MRRLATLPFGPLLLVAILPYLQWRVSAGIHPLAEAHRAALIGSAVLLAIMQVLSLTTRRPALAGLVGSLLAATALAGFGIILAASAIFGLIVVTTLIERRIAADKVVIGVNVLSLVMLSTLAPIIPEMLYRPRLVETAAAPIGAARLTQRPSILHFVLDGYGSAETIGAVYGHDTGPFQKALAARGFTVMEDARTPFNQTLAVMASVMSGADVQLREDATTPGDWRRNLGHTVQRGPVPWLLRDAGYTLASAPGGYGFLEFDAAIDVTGGGPRLSGLEAALLPDRMDLSAGIHRAELRAALAPGTLADLPQPFFYFQHMLAPHPPFVVTRDGAPRRTLSPGLFDGSHFVQGSAARRAAYVAGYAEKTAYVEDALIRQIDGLPPGPKIIILHGDHGPGAHMDHESADQSCLAERMTTFAAVYSDMPGIQTAFEAAADAPFNLVNIYRIIFSAISDGDYPAINPPPRFLRWSDPGHASAVPDRRLAANCPEGLSDQTGR